MFHWIRIRNSVFALHPGAGGSQASIINLWIIREGSSEEHGITINSAAVWSSSSVHLSSSLWEGGKSMIQSMGRISHEPVLKEKKKNSIYQRYQQYQQYKQLQNESSSHNGESSLS